MLDLQKLRGLIAVAEHGSLSRAADALHLSTPAVHKQLKLLEEELGFALYEKVGREIQLTAAADFILPHARAVLKRADGLLEAVDEWRGLTTGRVRVGTGYTFGTSMLPSLLKAYRSLHQGVEVVVKMASSKDLVGLMERGEVDVAFITALSLIDAPELDTLVSWTFERPLVASPVREFSPPAESLKDLRECPFILCTADSALETLCENYFLTRNFEPKVAMRFNSPEMMKAAVKSDLGVAFLPIWTVTDELESGELVQVILSDPPLRSDVSLVTRKLAYRSPMVEKFLDLSAGWHWNGALSSLTTPTGSPATAAQYE